MTRKKPRKTPRAQPRAAAAPRERKRRNGDRRREFDLADRRQRVFAAWCKGEAQYLIAERENVDPGQITRDLDHVLRELHGRDLDKAEESRLELLGKLMHAEAELLAAWERSKRPKDRRKGRKVHGLGRSGKGMRREAETITEGRDGNPKFWAELRAVWKMRADLQGLITSKVDLTTGGESFKLYAGFDPEKV